MGRRDLGAPDSGPPDLGSPDLGPPDMGGNPLNLDLWGYRLENREHSPPIQFYTLPAGTQMSPGDVLLIVRNASRAEVEAEFGPLGAHVQVITTGASSNGVPIINGGESWALLSPDGSLVDGATIDGAIGQSYRRTGGTASQAGSWTADVDSTATPGATSLPSSGVGLVISEWSDASGTGRFIFEFIELYYAP